MFLLWSHFCPGCNLCFERGGTWGINPQWWPAFWEERPIPPGFENDDGVFWEHWKSLVASVWSRPLNATWLPRLLRLYFENVRWILFPQNGDSTYRTLCVRSCLHKWKRCKILINFNQLQFFNFVSVCANFMARSSEQWNCWIVGMMLQQRNVLKTQKTTKPTFFSVLRLQSCILRIGFAIAVEVNRIKDVFVLV